MTTWDQAIAASKQRQDTPATHPWRLHEAQSGENYGPYAVVLTDHDAISCTLEDGERIVAAVNATGARDALVAACRDALIATDHRIGRHPCCQYCEAVPATGGGPDHELSCWVPGVLAAMVAIPGALAGLPCDTI